MQLAAYSTTASRFSVALLGAALLTGGLFYGLQGLIKPAVLQTQYLQIRSTIAKNDSLGSTRIDVTGVTVSLPEETESFCLCDDWFWFEPKAELADWLQEVSPVAPQNVYYLPLRSSDKIETVFRATILMRDIPAFSAVEEKQRVHIAFAVHPNGAIDDSTVAILSASDDRVARTAARMLKTWTYQPALKNGVPVRQENMEVVFVIEPATD